MGSAVRTTKVAAYPYSVTHPVDPHLVDHHPVNPHPVDPHPVTLRRVTLQVSLKKIIGQNSESEL